MAGQQPRFASLVGRSRLVRRGVACVLALALVASWNAASAHASSVLLSPPQTEENAQSWLMENDRFPLFAMTPRCGGTVSSASAVLSLPSTSSSTYEVLFYDGSTGSPGTPLGSLSVTGSATTTPTFSGSVSLDAGTKYWVGLRSSDADEIAGVRQNSGVQTSLWQWNVGEVNNLLTSDSGATWTPATTTRFPRLTLEGTAVGCDAAPSSSNQGPGALLQQFGKPVVGDCDSAQPDGLNWSGVSSGGWGESWSHWINEGQGGDVCTRTLLFDQSSQRWFVEGLPF